MRWFLKLAQWLKSLSTFVGNTLTNLSENSVFFKYCVKTKVWNIKAYLAVLILLHVIEGYDIMSPITAF